MKRTDPLCYYPPMARTEIILTVDALDPQSARGKLCVVIDVLRASTTIVAALAAGCPEIIPVETPEEARRLARARGLLLGGERNSLRPEGFDFGNSPLEYTPEKIKGRPIAFTTTNGTRAMRACRFSDKLVVACFLNASAITRLLKRHDGDTLIVCAGTRGEPSIEDTVCGGMLVEALGAAHGPEAEEAASLWNRSQSDLAAMMKKAGPHGKSLVKLGFGPDIDFAATLNKYDIAPVRKGATIVRETA